jgi:hypothetical protein
VTAIAKRPMPSTITVVLGAVFKIPKTTAATPIATATAVSTRLLEVSPFLIVMTTGYLAIIKMSRHTLPTIGLLSGYQSQL